VWATWTLVDDGRPITGLAIIAAVVALVVLTGSWALGVLGTSPGKAAMGLRLVAADTGRPVGFGPALLRTVVLGLAGLPTFGVGVAMLAWTAVSDGGHRRRGWHDYLTGSMVTDVRPAPPEVQVDALEQPRPIVNLTALRLAPVAASGPGVRPVPGSRRSPSPTGATPTPPVAAGAHPSVLAAAITANPTPAVLPGRRADEVAEVASGSQTGACLGRTGPPRWSLTLTTGERLVLDGLTLVGRDPQGRPGEPVARLWALPSADMSLSKTHGQFQVVPDGTVVVMDRGSTNGSLLVRGGITRELAAGRPATLRGGDVVRFGDREMRVSEEET